MSETLVTIGKISPIDLSSDCSKFDGVVRELMVAQRFSKVGAEEIIYTTVRNFVINCKERG